MSNRVWVAALAAAVIASAPAAKADEVVVRFNAGTTPAEKARALLRAGASVRLDLGFVNGVAATVPADGRAALAGDPAVAGVSDDIEVQATAGKPAPAPPDENISYGTLQVWDPETDLGFGLGTVKVAVIDTGIDLDHPDLAPAQSGPDFVNGDGAPDDDNGHGTHCAGIIGALHNGVGPRGVAPGVEVWAVKVLNRRGSGYLSYTVDALGWAAANGMNVASLSLSALASADDERYFFLRDAVEAARTAGVVVVCAAGNSNADASTEIPAGYSASFTVAAVGSTNAKASFSNYGPAVDVACYGVSIYSTYKGGSYATLSGTSMATPHVSAIAAHFIGNNPTATADMVEAALVEEAGFRPASGFNTAVGVANIVE